MSEGSVLIDMLWWGLVIIVVGKIKSHIYCKKNLTNDQVVHLRGSYVINMNTFHKGFQIHEAINVRTVGSK